MTFRHGPSAARRLLQPTRPASTPTGSPEPRFTGGAAPPVHPVLPACASASGCPFAGGGRSPVPRDDSHQPRFHGPGASVLSPPARLALALSNRGERVTPTRSARTPLVVEPRQRRVETPAMPGASPVRERRRDDTTSRAPSPAKAPRRVGVHEPPTIRRLGARLHRPHAQGRIGDRGPHHPFFREEDRDPPRPRCLPSVSMLDRDEPYLCSGMVLSTVCCQPVDNIRRLLQSRWDRRP